MYKWFEVLKIAQTINLSDGDDNLLCKLEPSGVYTVKSMYVVINFRGITPVNISAVWDIKVPPKIHFFLWLVTHNKLLTRDNLAKRQHLDDLTCLFCNKNETVEHLFFDCVIAKTMWDQRSCGVAIIPF